MIGIINIRDSHEGIGLHDLARSVAAVLMHSALARHPQILADGHDAVMTSCGDLCDARGIA